MRIWSWPFEHLNVSLGLSLPFRSHVFLHLLCRRDPLSQNRNVDGAGFAEYDGRMAKQQAEPNMQIQLQLQPYIQFRRSNFKFISFSCNYLQHSPEVDVAVEVDVGVEVEVEVEVEFQVEVEVKV